MHLHKPRGTGHRGAFMVGSMPACNATTTEGDSDFAGMFVPAFVSDAMAVTGASTTAMDSDRPIDFEGRITALTNRRTCEVASAANTWIRPCVW